MKRVLFVCNANLNRSPKAEEIVNKQGGDYKAKSAGLHPLAEIQITKEAIDWADIIVLMNERNDKQKTRLFDMFLEKDLKQKDIRILKIPDIYDKNNPELEKILINNLRQQGFIK